MNAYIFMTIIIIIYDKFEGSNRLGRENEIEYTKKTESDCSQVADIFPLLCCLPASMNRKIRVLIAKAGLDGHDRGAKVIAAALRDAGMEVIYTGLRQTPDMIVEAALQEDVDVIGISMLSGAHMTIFPRIRKLMDDKGLTDVLLTGGGIMSNEDIEALKKQGIGQLFTPGAPMSAIAEYIRSWVAQNRRVTV